MRTHRGVAAKGPLRSSKEAGFFSGLGQLACGWVANNLSVEGFALNAVALTRHVRAKEPRRTKLMLLRGKDHGTHGNHRSGQHVTLQSLPNPGFA